MRGCRLTGRSKLGRTGSAMTELRLRHHSSFYNDSTVHLQNMNNTCIIPIRSELNQLQLAAGYAGSCFTTEEYRCMRDLNEAWFARSQGYGHESALLYRGNMGSSLLALLSLPIYLAIAHLQFIRVV